VRSRSSSRDFGTRAAAGGSSGVVREDAEVLGVYFEERACAAAS